MRPLGFHYCAYRGGQDSARRVRAGIRLYDLLSNAFSRFKNLPAPVPLPASWPPGTRRGHRRPAHGRAVLRRQVDDARLVLEILKEARDASGGRSVALNYVRAVGLAHRGRGAGVALEDGLGGGAFTVRARCVVNATGAWTDATLALAGPGPPLLRPTKGVHLAVPKAPPGQPGGLRAPLPEDGRSFFVLRRGEVSVIGTTDTDYPGDLDAPWCNPGTATTCWTR